MRTGLRTEIILSISFLLAAALLFAGFLLVKLTEHNLLDQQRAHAAGIIKLVAAWVDASSPVPGHDNELNIAESSLDRLQTVMGRQPDIVAWRLLDTRLQVLASTTYETDNEFTPVSPSTLGKGQLYEELVYTSYRFFRNTQPQSYLDLSTALGAGNEPYGLLQVRFNLDSLHQRVLQAQRLTLVYVIVYGLILAAFGVYLLNRNVVKPVRQLHRATTAVAGGSLTAVTVSSGPGEIHDLADSFNQMVAALTASRAETEEHIASLEEINQVLARARDDLVRSEKLATVGHLAAGMAHEIGNPLGAVVGYLNILKDDLADDSRDLVERSLAETSRIDRLIRELLEYSAPLDRQVDSFCPIVLLRETVALLRHQGQLDKVEIEDLCTVDDCLVRMDRGRLMQVWINLLLNAQDALQGKGRIELAARQNGHMVSISIRDDGRGINPETAKKIFEPFFTTKAPGSGYGLGLAVCQRIIDESGGSVEVTSVVGNGACFTVVLP
ncbi:MAG: HAMP domain-containing sensor histidine kinase, partial [Desulfuromonadales bacterium]|nr:HAMP domain-containing sensor histidine kinase [Desulfuromonadales bacterium]